MSSNLDRIAIVDISIDSPIVNDANFDQVLILGHVPVNAVGNVKEMYVCRSLEEVIEIGYKATGTDADPVGVAARVAFSQSPRPTEIYIATVPMQDSQSLEPSYSIEGILSKALNTSGWYCICPVGLTDDEVRIAIEWTEAQTKICGYVDANPEEPIKTKGLFMRSYPFFPKTTENESIGDTPVENKYGGAVAMAIKAMHYHAGSEQWAHKTLAAVTPSTLSSTFINTLKENNFNYCITVAGKNLSFDGRMNSGEWIDVVRFRDWLQNDMQVRVVNLFVTNPKVPYTDNGIALVENQMKASLKAGQKYGGIAPDELFEDGSTNPGFVTKVPLAANISSVDKASRVLKDVKFTARIAGAILLTEISGNLTYANFENGGE